MKKLSTLMIAVIVLMTACTKQEDAYRVDAPTPCDGVNYTANGTTYNCVPATVVKLQGDHPSYSVMALPGSNNGLYFAIQCDSLGVRSYDCYFNGQTSTASVSISGASYVAMGGETKLAVNVSTYAAGKISGTFTGTMRNVAGAAIPVYGSFTNLVISY